MATQDKVNFTLYQGSTFTRDFYLKDELDENLDLSSYSFRGQIRSKIDNSLIGSFSFVHIDTEFVNMFIPAVETAAFETGTHAYDVEMYTENDAFVEKIFIGDIEIIREVTT